MIRKRGRPRKQKVDDGATAANFLVELDFPFELLQFCGGLQQQQQEQTFQAQICCNTVEDISINVNRESNRLKLLLQGLKDFPIHFIENKWCCKVKSVSLPEEGGEDDVTIDLEKPAGVYKQDPGNQEDIEPSAEFDNAETDVEPPMQEDAPVESSDIAEEVERDEADVPTDVVKSEADKEARPRNCRKRLAESDSEKLDTSKDAADSDNVGISASPARKSRRTSSKPLRFLDGKNQLTKAKSSVLKKSASESKCSAIVKRERSPRGESPKVAERTPKKSEPTPKLTKTISDPNEKTPVVESSPEVIVIKKEKPKTRGAKTKQETPSTQRQRSKAKSKDVESKPSQGVSSGKLKRVKQEKEEEEKTEQSEEKEEQGEEEGKLLRTIKSECTEKPKKQNSSKPVFKCDKCNAKLASEFSLQRHRIKTHNIPIPADSNPASIPEGGETTQGGSPDVKVDVLPKQEMFQCPECKLCYTDKKTLIKHVKTTHTKAPNYSDILMQLDEILYDSCKRYKLMSQRLITQKCPICGIERVGRSVVKHLELCHAGCEGYDEAREEMQKNYKKMHSESRRIMKKEYELREKKKNLVYMCQYCGKQFMFRPTRSNHENFRCTHNPNRRKLLECYTCGYATPSQEKYEAHVLTHNEAERLACDVCGTMYKTRAGLIVHRRKAHNIFKKHPIIPCTCDICGRSFYDKDHLNKHIATHSDARHFQCELCGSQFKTAAAVQKHQKMYHYNRYRYHCEKCGHGVEKANYLASHKCGRVRRVQAQEVNTTDPQKAKKKRAPKSKENQMIRVYQVNTVEAEDPNIAQMKTEEVSINLPSQEEYEDATQIVLQLDDSNLAHASGQVTVDLHNYITPDNTQGDFHAYSMPVHYESSSGAGETILQIVPDTSDNTLYTTLQTLDPAQGQVIISEEVQNEASAMSVLPEASVLQPAYNPFTAYKDKYRQNVAMVKDEPEGEGTVTYIENQGIPAGSVEQALEQVTMVEMVQNSVGAPGAGMQILSTVPQSQGTQVVHNWDTQNGLAYVTWPQDDTSASTTLTSVLVGSTQQASAGLTHAIAAEEVVVASNLDYEVKETEQDLLE